MPNLSLNPAVLAPKTSSANDLHNLGADDRQFGLEKSFFDKAFTEALNSKQTRRTKSDTSPKPKQITSKEDHQPSKTQMNPSESMKQNKSVSQEKKIETDREGQAEVNSSSSEDHGNRKVADSEPQAASVQEVELSEGSDNDTQATLLLSQFMMALNPTPDLTNIQALLMAGELSQTSPNDVNTVVMESKTVPDPATVPTIAQSIDKGITENQTGTIFSNILQTAASNDIQDIQQLINGQETVSQNLDLMGIINHELIKPVDPNQNNAALTGKGAETVLTEQIPAEIPADQIQSVNLMDKAQSLVNHSVKSVNGDIKNVASLQDLDVIIQEKADNSAETVLAATEEGKPHRLNMPLIQTQLSVNNSADKIRTDVTVLPSVNRHTAQNAFEVSQAAPSGQVHQDELFSQIIEKAKVMLNHGHSEMEVQLKPDNLGKLQLKVSLENQVVTAKFVAESQQVKEIIESNFSQLKRSLQDNGIQVDLLSVTVGQQNSNDGFRESAANNQGTFTQSHHPVNDGDDVAEAKVDSIGENRPKRETMIDLIA